MSWIVYGKPYYSQAELTGFADISQKVRFDKAVVFKAARIWLILHNAPAFTDLKLNIYTYSGSGYSKIAESTTSWDRADLTTLAYAVKEIYFEFGNINLSKDNEYYFTLSASNYSGASDSSHIAWRNGWPDPVLPEYPDAELTNNNIHRYPLTFYAILARFDEV